MSRTSVGWVVDGCPSAKLACACHLPIRRTLPRHVPWRSDQAELLADPIWQRQHGCAVTSWYRIPMAFRGLGTSIIAQLNELVPVWVAPLNADGHGPAALPVDGAAFPWSATDGSLPCSQWYDCYWQPLHTPCGNSTNTTRAIWMMNERDSRSADAPMMRTAHFRTRYWSDFEKRWGSLVFGAALLDIWWRPSAVLQALVDARLRTIHKASNDDDWSCVAVHVRRGDACVTSWRSCPPLDDYLIPARHLASKYGLRRLLVATDEQAVVDSLLKNVSREPWEEILHQRVDRSWLMVNATLANAKRIDTWVEHKLAKHAEAQRKGCHRDRRSEDACPANASVSSGKRPQALTPIADVITEIEAASKCSALVGMLDAAITELILLRMVSRLGHAPPLYSLGGTGFCPVSGGPMRCSLSGLPHPTADRDAEARRWEACRQTSLERRDSTARASKVIAKKATPANSDGAVLDNVPIEQSNVGHEVVYRHTSLERRDSTARHSKVIEQKKTQANADSTAVDNASTEQSKVGEEVAYYY